LFVPEQHFAVIILGNTNNVLLDKTLEKSMETVLSLKPKEEARAKTPQSLTESEMQKLVGTYIQPNRFKIEIFVKEGKLYIREFNQEMALNKIGENRFSFQFPQAKQPLEIYVQPAENGKVGFVHQYVWTFRKM
jgi:hypothetical protein